MAGTPGPNPSKWKYKDPMDHARHIHFLRARSQAWFRNEIWLLTFEDFCLLWAPNLWSQRGRSIESLCMSRDDFDGPWDLDNAKIMTRREYLTKSRPRRLKQPKARKIKNV